MNEIIIDLNGVIDDYGYFRSQVNYHLQKHSGQSVRLRLNSYGGSVAEALAISKLFEQHGNVTVELMGYAASAATWMGFGAKSVEMHEDTLWLCHKCSIAVDAWGYKNSDDLQKIIDELKSQKKSAEVIDLTIAKKYLDRCKDKTKNLQDILDLMKESRYISSEDCLAWGFVDKVIPGINKAQIQDQINIVNALNLPAVPDNLFPSDTNKKDFAASFESFFANLRSMFTKDKVERSSISQTTQTQNSMNEQFKHVNQLLGVTGLTEENGRISLSVADLQAIENELNGIQSACTALDAISDHVKNIEGLSNKINALKLVLDRIPTGMPGNSNPPDSDKSQIDTSKMSDPANSFAKSFKRKK